MNKTFVATALSNIALIKYMGKLDFTRNIPTNASLSYTLPELHTQVELSVKHDLNRDTWQCLLDDAHTQALVLSDKGQARYLAHFARIKAYFNINDNFLVRSNNNFPASCGLASSASSFAALTLAAAKACSELSNQTLPSLEELARWSRLGSGSSCRSLMQPFVLWQGESVSVIEAAYQELLHMVVIVDSEAKEISSSAAHKLVMTSPKFNGRVERVNQRLDDLLTALKTGAWEDIKNISWAEFMDMHELFSTSTPSFNYITEHSQQVLDYLVNFWHEYADGPVVTMDAGPNVHLLFRQDQIAFYEQIKKDLSAQFRIFPETHDSIG